MANIPISSFTAAANATGIGMSGFSLTGSNAQSMLDLAGTWNTSGTPTGLKLNVTDTASNAASLLMDLQTGGVSRFRVDKSGLITAAGLSITGFFGLDLTAAQPTKITGGNSTITFGLNTVDCASFTRNGGDALKLRSSFVIAWDSTFNSAFGTPDLILARDAANTLAQRNGVNAQTFRVYNTFTDASNYERVALRWTSNVFYIGSERGGTGTQRAIAIGSDGGAGSLIRLNTDGSINFFTSFVSGNPWNINTSGHFVSGTDNTYDIGASGASRPRNLYLGSNALFSNGSGVGRASADIQFYDAAVNVVKDLQLIGKFLSFQEQTAPAAPATNGVRIYAEDNGSGKTRLMALFATGVAQQIAIEP